MAYFIYGYGSLADCSTVNCKTHETAVKKLKKLVKQFCKENDVDIEETDYADGDESFYYEEECCGICSYNIYEKPKFNSKVEELLWNAKFQMDLADFAVEEYKYSLCCCDSDCYTAKARDLIDEAMKLIK